MNTAIQQTYLMDGFNKAHTFDNGDLEETLYELHADTHGGYFGIVESMEQYAEVVHEMLLQPSRDTTEKLGKWLFENPDKFFVPLKFSTRERHAIQSWFNPNQPPVADATTTEESTTMTVQELINQLQSLDYTLPVLTRGSESQKMVDAVEVRVVKTAKRTAVFIGKPKATT